LADDTVRSRVWFLGSKELMVNLGIVNLRNSGRLVPPNDGDGNRSGRGNGGDFSTSSSCGELIMGGEEEAHRCVLQHPLQYQRKETSSIFNFFVMGDLVWGSVIASLMIERQQQCRTDQRGAGTFLMAVLK